MSDSVRPKGWQFLRQNLWSVLELGHGEGNWTTRRFKRDDKNRKPDDDVLALKIETNEVSLIHSAIPFLSTSAAMACMILNIVLPGSGTCLSGFLVICGGQARIQVKENRVVMTILVNLAVGIAQFVTITFLCVGWGWSIAWGAMLLRHSKQYRDEVKKRRKEIVTAIAIRAFARDIILRPRDIRNLANEQHRIPIVVPKPDEEMVARDYKKKLSVQSL